MGRRVQPAPVMVTYCPSVHFVQPGASPMGVDKTRVKTSVMWGFFCLNEQREIASLVSV